MGSAMNIKDMSKSYVARNANPEGIYVDFTIGHGRDTEFLCSIAPNGKVYGFDVLPEAIAATRALLESKGYTNFELIHDGHENVRKYISEPIDGGMFNLGYFPGGDRTKHTMRYTTIKAVFNAMELLKKGGTITVNVYPGHPEGEAEGNIIYELLSEYNQKEFGIMAHRIINSPSSPYIFEILRYDK